MPSTAPTQLSWRSACPRSSLRATMSSLRREWCRQACSSRYALVQCMYCSRCLSQSPESHPHPHQQQIQADGHMAGSFVPITLALLLDGVLCSPHASTCNCPSNQSSTRTAHALAVMQGFIRTHPSAVLVCCSTCWPPSAPPGWPAWPVSSMKSGQAFGST